MRDRPTCTRSVPARDTASSKVHYGALYKVYTLQGWGSLAAASGELLPRLLSTVNLTHNRQKLLCGSYPNSAVFVPTLSNLSDQISPGLVAHLHLLNQTDAMS